MISIRLAKPQDWPMICRFHAEQNHQQGTNTELPKLFAADGEFAHNIALACVIEHDGQPVSSFYCELVPELCFAGCDPHATATVRREAERFAFGLRSMGYTGLRCVVPIGMTESIRTPLERAGFEDKSCEFTHFWKDLRLPKVEVEE